MVHLRQRAQTMNMLQLLSADLSCERVWWILIKAWVHLLHAAAWPSHHGTQPAVLQVVDVGCGIGGSSRHLARRFGAQTNGITLSPVQASRGNALAQQQGLGSQCSLQVLVSYMNCCGC